MKRELSKLFKKIKKKKLPAPMTAFLKKNEKIIFLASAALVCLAVSLAFVFPKNISRTETSTPQQQAFAENNQQQNTENATGAADQEAEKISENQQTSDAPKENADVAPPKDADTRRADLVIGLIADAHTGQAHGFISLSAPMSALFKHEKPDIVADLGDLIESRTTVTKYISKGAAITDYKRANSIISRYYKVYHALGDHELMSMDKGDLEDLTGRNNYYSVKVKGYNLIFLDTNYSKRGHDMNIKNDGHVYPGSLSDEEENWLEDQLEDHDKNLIFSHHPLYAISDSRTVEDIVRKNKKNVVMIANGHRHPQTLRSRSFGGATLYEIPSAYWQRTYATASLYGNKAVVTKRIAF